MSEELNSIKLPSPIDEEEFAGWTEEQKREYFADIMANIAQKRFMGLTVGDTVMRKYQYSGKNPIVRIEVKVEEIRREEGQIQTAESGTSGLYSQENGVSIHGPDYGWLVPHIKEPLSANPGAILPAAHKK